MKPSTCRSVLALAIGGWLLLGSKAAGQGLPAGAFVPAGNALAARWGHTATLLNDGRVLIAGGATGGGPDAEIYDPATGAFSPTGNMITPRGAHAAVLLTDGRVLLAGGVTLPRPYGSPLASAEIYDPTTGFFSPTGDMAASEWGSNGVLLNNGRVLVGGDQIFDPRTGKFTSANGKCDSPTTTRLWYGAAFMIGNKSICLYDPATGTIQSSTFNEPPLYFPTVTALQNGKILIAGGYAWPYGFEDTARAWIYDPAERNVQKTASLSQSRGSHTATLLLDGNVLITGGYVDDGGLSLASVELYRPDTGTFSTIGRMLRARSGHTATFLRDGRVLIVGGAGGSDTTSELFVPASYAGTTNCGRYRTTANGCRRIDILPWYAAIPGAWETDLELSAGGTPLSFDLSISPAQALTYGHNVSVWDHRGAFFADGWGTDLKSGQTYFARILSGVECQLSTCVTVNSTGSLIVAINGPDAAALDGARVRGTYVLYGQGGAAVGQTTVPAISRADASSTWRAEIVETPRSLQSRAGAAITSFAVANLSFVQQAVIVKVFDPLGNLIASAKTPVLRGAASLELVSTEDNSLVGGVYANTLSGLLGVDLPPGLGIGSDFRGTVTFEGEAGGKIAPVVIGGTWPAINAVSVTPQ